jgi:hypothetical protein
LINLLFTVNNHILISGYNINWLYIILPTIFLIANFMIGFTESG